MPWTEVPLPQGVTYGPEAPEGPHVALLGRCVPQGPNAGYYKEVEHWMRGRIFVVVVQLTITADTNGIRVWRSCKGTTEWLYEGSHFKNTLLADPDFDALISPMLIDHTRTP